MSSALAGSHLSDFLAAIQAAADTPPQTAVRNEFAVDGMPPDAAVAPSTIPQLQTALAEAHEAGLALVPMGGGTRLALGNIPASYDVALSLARLDRIVEHEPADLTVTVEAGIRLAALQGRLAQHGQFLPLDPPSDPLSTVGGVLAANAYGPSRHAFGTARDWLIGIRVVHADGSTTKSGGRVVKNVTGYDMHKLHIGSLGTLGVIAEATFKVAPLPRSAQTLAVTAPSARAACELAHRFADGGLALTAVELLSPPAAYAVLGHGAWTLLLRAAGGTAAVTRTIAEITNAAAAARASVDELDEAAWAAWHAAFAPRALSLRVAVPPSGVADAAAALDRRFIGAAGRLSATVSAGVIRATLDPTYEQRAPALLRHAQEVARGLGGSVVVDAAPLALKREIDVFGELRADFAIMQRLKQEFDPQRVLSPGRFVGKL